MGENQQKYTSGPRVSVVIPFHNREDYLREAVESVLNQTADGWEIVLVDDGSSDSSTDIANEFVSKRPDTVKLYSHPDKENKGASASRRLGIEKSRGEFITFLDSDDVLLPDAIEIELKAFEDNPGVNAVCGSLECWYSWSGNADGREKDFVIDLMLKSGKVYQPPDLLVHNLKSGGRKPGINCVMIKADFARDVGVFEEDYNYAWEDQVFWAKVSLYSPVYVIEDVLARYRQHPASTCAIESRNGRDTPSMNIFLDWLEDYLAEQEINDNAIEDAIRIFRRKVALESKVLWLKQFYRKNLSLKTRYEIRNRWIGFKQMLSRTTHRHE